MNVLKNLVANLTLTTAKKTIIGTAVVLGGMFSGNLLAAQVFYWPDAATTNSSLNTIRRANLDGSNVQVIIPSPVNNTFGVAIDANAGKLYWAEGGNSQVEIGFNRIRRSNLDGTNIETVLGNLNFPIGIALDPSHNKMYWANFGFFGTPNTQSIQRANLDGTNVETLVNSNLLGPTGIALDISGGKMYWTDTAVSPNSGNSIKRANLDGTNVETLVSGLDVPTGIALDITNNKVYWTNFSLAGNGKIQRASLDGTNVEDVIPQGTLQFPSGLALDNGKMYWSDEGTLKIQRANLNGSNIEDLVTQGLEVPRFLAIGDAPVSTPESSNSLALIIAVIAGAGLTYRCHKKVEYDSSTFKRHSSNKQSPRCKRSAI